jgi:hypothetical protein
VSLSQDLYTKIAELTIETQVSCPTRLGASRYERAAMIHRDT